MTLIIGTKVRLVKAVDIYPHGIWEVGETGLLARLDEDGSHWIKLDTHYPELDEWDNEIQIWNYSEQDGSSEHPSTYYEAVAA